MFTVTSESIVSEHEVKNAVQQGLNAFLGVYGCAKAGIIIVENNNQQGIVKVDPKYVNQAKTALISIKEINKNPVMITCPRVSGMINKVKQEVK
ncbi:MAG: Rpp14/Pop5 family protein [Nanoarchaeota archaeon]